MMGTRRSSGFSLVQLVGPVWRHCQLGQPGKQQSGQSGKVTLATLNHSICQSDKELNLAKSLIIPKKIISGNPSSGILKLQVAIIKLTVSKLSGNLNRFCFRLQNRNVFISLFFAVLETWFSMFGNYMVLLRI